MLRSFFAALVVSFVVISCNTLSGLPQNNIPLTEAEAAQGIREALEQGVGQGIAVLHREDGFFNNNAYKIGMPPEAQNLESTLRKMGMDAMVDRAILQINRAAEDAVGVARPIFANAIRELTVTDALNIIAGSDSAATQYFLQNTSGKLKEAFAPIIQASLDKFSATKYYSEIAGVYNDFPTTMRKINPNLTAYVTNKTVSALFNQIAKEEANIRNNASARSSQILKRVFGRRAG